MSTGISKKLSIILLAYHSGDRLRRAFSSITAIFEKEQIDFELVIIDDGSRDGGLTKEVGISLEDESARVRYFELSRNYTSHYAAFAGLSVCEGGCACIIPDDEQQPYDTLVRAYRLWELGEKIILPV